jgi:2-polyprenyl-3-methyl-5-hydroxy-6-metoxy-1,4-benzoquinol methylase
VDRVEAELATDPGPDAERITTALWAGCGGGHLAIAKLLAGRGADVNWVGWGDETPLDVARKAEAPELVAWLQGQGAHSATEAP